jgi:hypothetical protein
VGPVSLVLGCQFAFHIHDHRPLEAAWKALRSRGPRPRRAEASEPIRAFPANTRASLAMRIQQISDYGTSNPIVARLSIQTKDILQFYRLSEEQHNDLWGAFFTNLQPKLMTCFRIKEKLKEEVLVQQKAIDDHGLPMQAQGRAYTLPSILDLEHRAETFLYNAKSVLRI